MDTSHPIIDSHAHLNMEEFDRDREEVLNRAFSGNISAILCPADLAEPDRLQVALDLEESYENIILAAGVHPHLAKDYQAFHPEEIKGWPQPTGSGRSAR